MRIFRGKKWSVVSGQWSGISDQCRVTSGQKRKKKLSLTTHHSSLNMGFTLIELMAVVAIIMILAAIMIPNVAKNVERGRVAKATADIDVLIKAVSLFQVDNGILPTNLSELWTATASGQGPYISTDQVQSLKTPWGGTYTIEKGDSSYTIKTTDTGKDGNPKVSKTITFGNIN